jgi:hypothetical protein
MVTVLAMATAGLLTAAVGFIAGALWSSQKEEQQQTTQGEDPLRARTVGNGQRFNPRHCEPAKEGESACAVCMHNRVDALLVPCNHVVVCQDCAQHLNQCPYCREPVSTRERVFL